MSAGIRSYPSAMAQETLAGAPAPWRGLTRERYDAMVRAGLLDGAPVELIEGVLVEVVPQGDAHARSLRALNRWLVPRLPEPWVLGVQTPLSAGERSEPEPDLSVVQEPPSGHPPSAVLVVELAVSSQRTDLVHKPRVYAAAGVTEYWVVDLPAAQVVVHRRPGADGYADVERRPWTAPLEVLGVPVDLAALLDV